MAIAGRVASPAMFEMAISGMKAVMSVPGRDEFEGRDVILVNSPTVLTSIMTAYYNAYYGKAFPASMQMLCMGMEGVEVTCLDEKRVVVRAVSGDLLRFDRVDAVHFGHVLDAVNGLFRDRDFPMEKGKTIVADKFTVEVLAVDDVGMPTEALFTFSERLKDSGLHWIWFDWREGEFKDFQMPEAGESVTIAGVPQVSLAAVVSFAKEKL